MKKEKMLIVLTNTKSPIGYVVCNNSTKCVCSVKLQSRVFGIAVFRAQTDFVRIINGEKSFDFEFDCNTLANLEIFIVTETETFYGASGRKIPQITISEVRNKYAFEKKNELDAKNENHSSQTVVYDDQKTHKSTTTLVAESQLVENPKVQDSN